jgi:hypothetical protein
MARDKTLCVPFSLTRFGSYLLLFTTSIEVNRPTSVIIIDTWFILDLIALHCMLRDRQARTAQVNQPTSASGNSPELTTCRCIRDGKVPKRNLVICIDGTSNQFSDKVGSMVRL